MPEIDRRLATRLRRTGVRIDVPDTDTAFLRGVPVNAAAFNKPATNVLVKRARQGMPFLVCVDEDLQYTGADPTLVRLFVGGVCQEGWRILGLGGESTTDFDRALRRALVALGFDGREPSAGPAVVVAPIRGGEGLLAAFGTDLTAKVAAPEAEPTVGRSETIDEVVSCVLRWGQTRLPLIVGDSGVGKTNLLFAVARRLSGCRPGLRLVAVDLGAVLAGALWEAEREDLVTALGREAAAAKDLIVAVEHLELGLTEMSRGPVLLAHHLDAGARLIGTTLPAFQPAFHRAPLARRLQAVELAEPGVGETVAVLKALSGAIAAHHRVEIDDPTLRSCVQAARSLPGCFPAKAIALLDAAASRAALAGAAVVGSDDVCFAADQVGTGEGEDGQ
jgi:ATP-dependent Clp protease ATP-binding subunit ClpA